MKMWTVVVLFYGIFFASIAFGGMATESRDMNEETDVMQTITDFCAQAKRDYLDSLSKPPPRFVVPQWLVDYAGWTQKDLDAYWLEVL